MTIHRGLHRREGGFTVVEVMITLSIIGILSSIATVTLSKSINNAKNARLQVMVRNLADDLHAHVDDYDLQHRYSRRGGNAYLNNKVEDIWENAEYDNVFSHRNPYSQSKVVLNWTSVPGSLKHPAIFVTDRPRFSYDRLGSRYAERNLRGSLVVWMRNGNTEIDIYYVDVEGKKSRLRHTVE
jgi:prepilin-type N-terminal cleavage/methylation domain-containing protein